MYRSTDVLQEREIILRMTLTFKLNATCPIISISLAKLIIYVCFELLQVVLHQVQTQM